ncbi:hypothetical protein BDW42DRAFT_160778 [Aspergillus taichungensis]|uniref:Uncharacterized protein n=1 Tax=Aspergillus taichungensis TaxID=482145 RepID=A0A2J5I5W1_9EURO|nr:hypothetical protein BDW42DRAFT_160778 [Aspergillus taichungensis]
MGHPTEPPPSYDQATASSSSASHEPPIPQHTYPKGSPPPPALPSPPADSPIPDAIPYHSLQATTRKTVSATLSPTLSQDPCVLHDLVATQAHQPPRPHLTVRGTHNEIRSRPDRKENENHAVLDFDFSVDLTPYFLASAAESHDRWWQELSVVRDGDGTLAYRGGRIRSRTGCAQRRDKRRRRGVSVEEGGGQDDTVRLVTGDDDDGDDHLSGGPGLMGWCERFCWDAAGVKSFTFKRRIDGFDASAVRSALTSHLRTLNYQGNIHISIELTNRSFVVYSPHWINRLRNTAFIYYVCVILPLWILAWPIIWLLERRYEVAEARWLFARQDGPRRLCVGGRDEAHIAQDLAPVVTQAAWERRTDGRVLTPQEMDLLRRLEQEGRERGGRMLVVNWDQISGWGRDCTIGG